MFAATAQVASGT